LVHDTLDLGLHAADDGLQRAAERARGRIAAQLFEAPGGTRLAARYRLVRPLGEGGQGVVWLAIDERLDREVAIKTVRLDVARAADADRWLRREAILLASISHPNVVAVFDLGLCDASELDPHASGGHTLLFLVMERVHGTSLEAWLAAQPRSTDEILAVMRQVADGLAVIERATLVHCDVKPSNVLIGAMVKLADLGLAHTQRGLLGGAMTRAASLARTVPAASATSVGGTPLYMAPEQLIGGGLDARADEYAFAATLFDALFGRPPHDADTLADLAIAKHCGPPPSPDATRLGGAAYRALARGLAADPAERHGSATALMTAIDRARRRAKMRRSWWLLGLAGAGAIGWVVTDDERCSDRAPAVDLDALQRWGAEQRDEPHIAARVVTSLRAQTEQLAAARELACTAKPPARDVIACLDRVEAATTATLSALRDGGDVAPMRALGLVERLGDPHACVRGDADPREVGPDLETDDPSTRAAWASFSQARALAAIGRDADALAMLDAIDDPGALTAEIGLARAETLQSLARIAEAEAAYREVWDRAEQSDASLDAARAANGLAWVIGVELRRSDEGLEWVRHGEARLERSGALEILHSRLLGTRGSIEGARGNYEAARRDFASALELQLAEGAPPATIAATRENLGVVLVGLGDPAAIDALEATLRWREEQLGPDHPDVARSLAHLGWALRRFGRDGDARGMFERSLAIREATLGPMHLEVARSLSSLAELDSAEGHHAEALQLIRRAAAIRERVLGPDHPDTASAIVMLVELDIAAGDREGAQRVVAANVDRFAATFAPDNPISLRFEAARRVLAR
jgi:tetratricopeptide (TPR) repeat protein